MDFKIMAYTESINTNYNFPNLDIVNHYRDGDLYRYEIRPLAGFVVYDTNEIYTEIDPETNEEKTVIFYSRVVYLPLNYNLANFSYVAVLESEVPADMIFGGVQTQPPHEIA